MMKVYELWMKTYYLLCQLVSRFTVVIFGESKHSLDWFKNITREWHEKDPKYAKVKVYQGKKMMFAVKTKKGKLKDVPCLIVNNRFVILDPDTKKRKYAIW